MLFKVLFKKTGLGPKQFDTYIYKSIFLTFSLMMDDFQSCLLNLMFLQWGFYFCPFLVVDDQEKCIKKEALIAGNDPVNQPYHVYVCNVWTLVYWNPGVTSSSSRGYCQAVAPSFFNRNPMVVVLVVMAQKRLITPRLFCNLG